MAFATFSIVLVVVLGVGFVIGKAIDRHGPADEDDEHREGGVG